MVVYFFGVQRCYERYAHEHEFYRYEHTPGYRMGIDIVLVTGIHSIQGRKFQDDDEVVACGHCYQRGAPVQVAEWENLEAMLQMGMSAKTRSKWDERH
jgi:hypothetical protein